MYLPAFMGGIRPYECSRNYTPFDNHNNSDYYIEA